MVLSGASSLLSCCLLTSLRASLRLSTWPRHSCFFFGQSNALEVATRTLAMHVPAARLGNVALLGALGGRTIHFIGDSVLRQLCQAVMCRLRHHLLHDGTAWWDPMKRRHPALDYKGMCPFSNARHCEMRSGCAVFGLAGTSAGRGTVPSSASLSICYSKEERLGWEGLHSAIRRLTSQSAPATAPVGKIKGGAPRSKGPVHLVVSSGHHHPPSESLYSALLRQWGGTNDSMALGHRSAFIAAARRSSHDPPVRILFQQAEPQHFPTADGGFYTGGQGRTARLQQCEPLDAASIGRRVGTLERALVLPYLVQIQGGVLETNTASEAAWWAHTYAAPTPSGNSDCTHWCMPGLPDVWATMLLEQLARDNVVQQP